MTRRRAVRPPSFPAEHDVLHQVQKCGLPRSERTSDNYCAIEIDDLAKAVPIDCDNARERDAAVRHGACPSARYSDACASQASKSLKGIARGKVGSTSIRDSPKRLLSSSR